MQRRISQPEFLPKGILAIGVTVLFTTIVVLGRAYSMYKDNPQSMSSEGVLGEKSIVKDAETVCNSANKLEFELKTNSVVIPLYAPDGDFSLEVGNIASCISFPSCSNSSTCAAVSVAVDSACINTYLDENPLSLNDDVEIKGEDRSIMIRKQDWVISQNEFAKQVATLLARDLLYCELSGESNIEDARLDPIVVHVTDILPSAPKDFADRFIEIDQTKEKLYLWQNGIYQEYRMTSGVEVGEDRIVIREHIDMTKMLGSADRTFVIKVTEESDLVIVHK